MMDTQNRPKTRSLSELCGLGADIWDGVDAQKYIDALRDEWAMQDKSKSPHEDAGRTGQDGGKV